MAAYISFHFDATNPDVLQKHGQVVMQTLQGYDADLVYPPVAVEALEGDAFRSMNVMLKFNSAEEARGWYYSDAYQEGKKVRDGELNMIVTLLA